MLAGPALLVAVLFAACASTPPAALVNSAPPSQAPATPRPTSAPSSRIVVITPVPVPTATATPVPTPFVASKATKITAEQSLRGKRTFTGTKSLKIRLIDFLAHTIMWKTTWSASAGARSDCHWETDLGYQLSPEADPALTWTADPKPGASDGGKQARTTIEWAFPYNLTVRTDCPAWSLTFSPIDLTGGVVPGAPKRWDGYSDLDCSDFKTQKAAQSFHDYFAYDIFWLDLEGDGVACEFNP